MVHKLPCLGKFFMHLCYTDNHTSGWAGRVITINVKLHLSLGVSKEYKSLGIGTYTVIFL